MSQGIFGIIDFDEPIENPYQLLDTMTGFLVKDRVNNGQLSYITDNNYFFAMKRTFSGSFTQSKVTIDNELQAVCLMHGEINNYEDLSEECSTDTDMVRGDLGLIIHLFRRHGPDFVKKLNGLFSLAILDKLDSSLILLNDRFGLAHQVYWGQIGSRFYFSTYLKSLLTLPEIKREIDFKGLNLFFKYSYIPSPYTIVRNIRKLPPGHLLAFKNGTVNVVPYWQFKSPNDLALDLQGAIHIYKDLLRKSISRRLGSNGQVGILLSGGLDSSANVALAVGCIDRKLKTFSVGFDNPAFDERPYARIVAKHFNTEHYETTITGQEIEDLPKLIWHLEEPYFEFGLFLTYKGLEAAKKEVDIVIGGEGADQLFGTGGFAGGRPAALHYLLLKYHLLGLARGATSVFRNSYFYNYDNLAFKFRMLWDRAVDLNNWYFYGYDQHELIKLYRDPKLAIIPRIFPDSDSLSPQSSVLSPQSSCPTPYTLPPSFEDFFYQTQINQDLKHYVNENVMVKSGRMADMLGLTLREAYLDTEVTDFLTSLDFPMKRDGGVSDHLRGKIKTKLLHRKTVEGLLPPEIMNKPKQGGFVPVMIFLKDSKLRRRIYRHLLDSEVITECFRRDYIESFFESYEQKLEKEMYWYNFYNSKANRVLFLLTFDIWHHLYIENQRVDSIPSVLSDYIGSME